MSQKPEKDAKRKFVLQNYWDLAQLQDEVQICQSPYIAPDELPELGITLSTLDWHPNTSIDLESRFCDPFPDLQFDKIWEREIVGGRLMIEEEWPSDKDAEFTTRLELADALSTSLAVTLGVADYPDDPARHGDWTRIGRESRLYKYLKVDNQWSMHDVRRAIPWPQDPLPTDADALRELQRVPRPDREICLEKSIRRPGKKPLIHAGCTVIENNPPKEDMLLRSEVLCATSIMRSQMRQTVNWEYGIFPVFVYSFSGLDARVLQCHYDPRTCILHCRKTSYIHIGSDEETDKIKLVLRWMMNKPKGDLKLQDIPNLFEDVNLELREKLLSQCKTPVMCGQ